MSPANILPPLDKGIEAVDMSRASSNQVNATLPPSADKENARIYQTTRTTLIDKDGNVTVQSVKTTVTWLSSIRDRDLTGSECRKLTALAQEALDRKLIHSDPRVKELERATREEIEHIKGSRRHSAEEHRRAISTLKRILGNNFQEILDRAVIESLIAEQGSTESSLLTYTSSVTQGLSKDHAKDDRLTPLELHSSVDKSPSKLQADALLKLVEGLREEDRREKKEKELEDALVRSRHNAEIAVARANNADLIQAGLLSPNALKEQPFEDYGGADVIDDGAIVAARAEQRRRKEETE